MDYPHITCSRLDVNHSTGEVEFDRPGFVAAMPSDTIGEHHVSLGVSLNYPNGEGLEASFDAKLTPAEARELAAVLIQCAAATEADARLEGKAI